MPGGSIKGKKWVGLFGVLALILLIWGPPGPPAPQAQTPPQVAPSSAPKSILLLYSAGYYLPAYRQNLAAFFSVMEGAGFPVNRLHFEHLDLIRHTGPEYRRQLLDLLHRKYADKKIDLIITVEGLARDFILNDGRRLLPETPLLAILSADAIDAAQAPRKIVQIPSIVDYSGTLNIGLSLFPKTKRVFIVLGTSPDEQLWEKEARSQFAPWAGRLEFEYASGLTYQEAQQRVGSLPPESIVIFIALYQDKTGRSFVPRDAAMAFARKANVPVFGTYDQILPLLVGGSMMSYGVEGARAARLALDILDGKFSLAKPLTTLKTVSTPNFNWTELERWGVGHGKLPAGSIVINRPASIWDSYKEYVIGSIALIALQTGMIIALLVMRKRRIDADKKRQEAEEAVAANEQRYRTLVENAQEGILVLQDQRVKFANPFALAVAGFTWDELASRPFLEFVHPEDRQRVAEAHGRRLAGEEVEPAYTIRFIDKAGQTRWLEIGGARIAWEGRHATLNFITDVTERKRAEEITGARLRLMQSAPGQSLPELLRATLDEVGLLTESSVGFFHFVAPDQKTLALQAWSTRTTQEFCQARGEGLHYSVDQAGVWADCVRERRTVIHNDYASLPNQRGLPPGHAEVIRELVVPISRGERIVAILGVGNKPLPYTGEDADLVARLADVAWEIAQHKQIEQALVESEGLLNRAQEIAHLGHWKLNPATGMVEGSDELFRIFGLTRQEFAFEQFSDAVHPDQRDFVVGTIGESVAQGKGYDIQHWLICKDGTHKYIRAIGEPVRDRQGRVAVMMGTVQDITEHKLAEEALRKSEEKFSKAFMASPVWVAVTTVEDGRFLEVNDTFTTESGYTREEAIGRTSLELNLWLDPERDRQRAVDIYRQRGKFHNLEVPMRFKDGQVHTLLWSVDPFEFDGQDCFLNVMVDITDQKKAQEASAKLEAQLRQTQKMEAIGTLAGGIAHDFNNILGAVLGFAEMAREDALDGKADPRDLDQIIASAGRAKELVQQILTFSRKMESDLSPCDVNHIVRSTQAILERTLPKMISIEVHLAEDPPPVKADHTQLEQVLLNLASNAADAMPEGGRLIIETRTIVLDQEYCREHLEVQAGLFVLLTVTDTGMGMDKHTRERIFEPFYTTKEIGKGTGLGLASAYGIVKSHGGHMHCYSEVGMGTSFKIYLPAFEQWASSDQDESAPVPGDAPTGTETILVVDDEDALRGLGARTLKSKGYQVLTATSGEEALEIYREKGEQLDLVIMDLGMPGMGGHKALKAIMELNPRAKVVIASGYLANGQVKASLESGAAGYVAKPFRRSDLLATVRSVLDMN
jgi:PAS domain S-box-containing protein